MRHNKFIQWKTVLGMIERAREASPWLSRQIAKTSAEWPFWYSGMTLKDWNDEHVHVHMPVNKRNAVEGLICQGHMVLGAELALRLLLSRRRQEFPFHFQIKGVRTEVHHALDRALEFKLQISHEEFERIRIALARESTTEQEFILRSTLEDGRLAATIAFQVGFQLEKFLDA